MSKSATQSQPKLPTQLSKQSAWAKGPPTATAAASPSRNQTPQTSRPSSPAIPNAPTPSHSRRPSTLGQPVTTKDGVSVPQRNASAMKQASSVTFGSIADASAPLSSSPASVPTLKPQGVTSFGTVPAASPTAAPQVNGKPSTPKSATAAPPTPVTPSAPTPARATPAPAPAPAAAPAAAPAPPAAAAPTKPSINKADIAKLFQAAPPPAPAPASEPSPARSPAVAASALPGASAGAGGAPALPNFTPFVPAQGFRGTPQPPPPPAGPNGAAGAPPPASPRSPVYQRPGMPNGAGPRPPSNGAPPPQMAPSPRMAPHHVPPVPAPGMPPQGMPPVQGWAPYGYYPGMPQEYMQPYSAGWYMPPGMPPHQGLPHQHPHPHPHHPPPGQPGALPLSPRTVPQALVGPGTPAPAHAVPPSPAHAPGAIPSAPGTPGGGGSGGAPRLNSNASAFVPGGGARSKVIIKDSTGREVNVDALRKQQNGASAPAPPLAPVLPQQAKRQSVRIESEQAKLERERKEREEQERKEREEREAKERAEREAREKEAAELRAKEEAERKAREEEQRKAREEEERKAREAAELRAKEEAARRAREEEEERARKAQEEAERLAREEEERRRAEEEEARRKEEEERLAEERRLAEEQRLAEERAAEEQRKKEEEEAAVAAAAAAEAEAAAKAAAAKAAAAKAAAEEKEEGEITEDAPAPEKPKTGLKIDTAVVPNERKRPGPLDLSSAQQQRIPGPLPSALATARIIEDINQISYPDGIASPKAELNMNAKEGKFRYDRDFLLQFMSVCRERPDSLPPLDAIGLEPVDPSQFNPGPRGTGTGRRTSGAMQSPAMQRQGSVGLGILPGGVSSRQAPGFGMGHFGRTSEERFAMSPSSRTPSGVGPNFRGTPISRTSSQQGSGRTRSKRGEKRGAQDKGPGGSGFAQQQQQQQAPLLGPDGQPLGPVKPLEKSDNAWSMPKTRSAAQDQDSPEMVDRKVKGLLNKLTMEKFDSISDQIISWANKSENQTDGRTLIQVIRLVFEKATDEAAWSEMYARLCRKMMEQISPKVQDEGIKNAEGKPITGGQLFRKYLLNRCQEDFERGWAQKDAAAAAAAAKATDDEAAAKANQGKKEDEEVELYSDEYYAAQKAKRQGLGLVKFIGELFKLQMLTERIMHECVKKLLNNVDNPEEEEIESLCKLLTTVGKMLDTPRAGPYMDIYFTRMRDLQNNPKVSSRMQFMLMEVIELRDRKWVPRNQSAAPATIAQIREDAAKETQQREAKALSMSRTGSRRGGDRSEAPQVGPDGWTTTGSTNRAPPKAGDLSKFGQINKPPSGQLTFGPSSVFNKKEGSKRDSASLSRTSSMNTFALLSQNPEMAAEVAQPSSGKTSRPASRKPSIDLGSGGAPELAPQRRKIQLLPRSKPVEDASAVTPSASEPGSPTPEDGEMSEAEADKKIGEDMKEFFAVRNIDEAEDYFIKLPPVHRSRLVDKLVTRAIESKPADAQLVGELFARAVEKALCTADAFEQGFTPVAEMLDDIAIDAPKAFDLMAIMMKGASLDKDDERRTRIAEKSMDSDKLLGLLA